MLSVFRNFRKFYPWIYCFMFYFGLKSLNLAHFLRVLMLSVNLMLVQLVFQSNLHKGGLIVGMVFITKYLRYFLSMLCEQNM